MTCAVVSGLEKETLFVLPDSIVVCFFFTPTECLGEQSTPPVHSAFCLLCEIIKADEIGFSVCVEAGSATETHISSQTAEGC